VPTVRRSESSIEQMALREAPRRNNSGTIHKKISPLPATVHGGNQPRRNRSWIGFLLLFLLLGLGGWYATQNGLLVITAPSTSTPTSTPRLDTAAPLDAALSTPTVVPASPTLVSASATLTETSAPTDTFTPEPSATATLTQLPTETVAPTEIPTETSTQVSSTQVSVQDTPTAAPVVAGVPTIKYPNGFRFSFFWNDTSFYMLNNYGEPRSFAAFVFERLDANDQPTDRFTGHRWENAKLTYIPKQLCTGIRIYGDEDPPYLSPIECRAGYAGIVQPRKEQDRALFFWNPKSDGSTQFRVIFNKEEVGRCEINAGTCEVYIP
jgi:hypothetical protein